MQSLLSKKTRCARNYTHGLLSSNSLQEGIDVPEPRRPRGWALVRTASGIRQPLEGDVYRKMVSVAAFLHRRNCIA